MTPHTTTGSIALLSHFHKVLAFSKFALLKCAVLVAQGIHATGFTSFSHFKSANFESANTLAK